MTSAPPIIPRWTPIRIILQTKANPKLAQKRVQLAQRAKIRQMKMAKMAKLEKAEETDTAGP